MKTFTKNSYENEFLKDIDKNRLALSYALDIRKFEIELYWKRAAYFWTFIAATFAGFIALQSSNVGGKTDMSILLSCIGIVFSIGWLCVNRGSKHWQENWENHVDMLEDKVIGPLYKVVLTRPKPKGAIEVAQHFLTGPTSFSVSKINQLISLFVCVLWVGLLFYSLPKFDALATINYYYILLIITTFMFSILFVFAGRTYNKKYIHKGSIRSAEINGE